MQLTSDSDRITRDYFDSLLLETRYVDAELPTTAFSLFGETFKTPIMTAALSHLNGTAPDGMVAYARAAKMSGAVHWVGMGEDAELEAILATGARTVKVIKPHTDNREVLRKIEHAVSHGCFAVGMDIDHAFNGAGGYDNVMGLPMKAKSTAELADFVQAAGIPFVAKGVLSAHDAERCLKAGCAGLVVSHHHGMIPYAVPPLMALPEVLSAVGGSVPVFVDCGIVSGADAYLRLIEAVDRPAFGVHLDVVNMITTPRRYFFNDEFLEECFAKLGGAICSCHLKDIRLREEYTFQLEECACGAGTLDIPRYLRLATACDPAMPMIIEHLDTDEEYLASVQYVQALPR